MGTGQGRAHSRPLPGRASLCIPPSSKAAEECVFTEEKQARLRDSRQGPRAAPQRPLPSPLVHIQGQGKPIESNARLSNQRTLGETRHGAERKMGFKYQGRRPGGRPHPAHSTSHLPVPSPGPLHSSQLLPRHIPAAGEGRRGQAAAGAQASRPPQPLGLAQSFSPPKALTGLSSM